MADLAQKIADAVEVALGDDGHCVVYKAAAVRDAIRTALPVAQGEAVAWRWSENSGKTWFDWRCDWTHHNSAEEKGFPIEYARIPAGQAASARIAELEREVERLREAMRDAAEFWAHYSAVNESCQDKMNNERLAMLERMEALAADKGKNDEC